MGRRRNQRSSRHHLPLRQGLLRAYILQTGRTDHQPLAGRRSRPTHHLLQERTGEGTRKDSGHIASAAGHLWNRQHRPQRGKGASGVLILDRELKWQSEDSQSDPQFRRIGAWRFEASRQLSKIHAGVLRCASWGHHWVYDQRKKRQKGVLLRPQGGRLGYQNWAFGGAYSESEADWKSVPNSSLGGVFPIDPG